MFFPDRVRALPLRLARALFRPPLGVFKRFVEIGNHFILFPVLQSVLFRKSFQCFGAHLFPLSVDFSCNIQLELLPLLLKFARLLSNF